MIFISLKKWEAKSTIMREGMGRDAVHLSRKNSEVVFMESALSSQVQQDFLEELSPMKPLWS